MEEPATLEELLETLRAQKTEIAAARQEKLLNAKLAREQKRREIKHRGARHPAGWNPSVNMNWFNHFDFQAGEPAPNGKDFDLDGRSIWPVIKRIGTGDGPQRKLQPWLAVRNGDTFEPLKLLGPGSAVSRSEEEDSLLDADDADGNLGVGHRHRSRTGIVHHRNPWLTPKSCNEAFSRYPAW